MIDGELTNAFVKVLSFIVAYRKAKLYRFDKERTEWKERGVGQVKLLQHKQNDRIRVLMRQNRTLKICANFVGRCFM